MMKKTYTALKKTQKNLHYSFLLLLAWSISIPAISQIHFTLTNATDKSFYLQQIKGDRLYTLDSALIENEELSFEWKTEYLPGMYRLFDGKESLVFLGTEDEIKLNTTYPPLQENLKVIHSIENEIWFNYLQIKETSYKHLDLLNPIINWYDKESTFYQFASMEFEKQQNLLPNFVEKLETEDANSLALQFVKTDLKPPLPMGLSLNEQEEYFKQHWFDGVDWYNNDLIISNILTNKITEYLGLYADRNMSKAELEMAFKYAVDQIIPFTQDNDDMYAFVLDYLLRGFEQYNFEEVILHIALNYPPPSEQCENEERKSEALARLAKYKDMQIGQTAPDFILPLLNGENIKLSKCEKDKILLVFWASWCPHCKDLIPQIENWYTNEKQKSWQVYCISIDSEKQELEAFIKSNNIQIPILCNFQGWDTQAALDYNIYATPTMIVLDKDLQILEKPSNLNELNHLL